MAEELSSSKRGIKLLGKKKTTEAQSVSPDTSGSSPMPAGKPTRRLGKKTVSAQDISASPQSKGGGGKGIESIQRLVSKNKRRFVGTDAR